MNISNEKLVTFSLLIAVGVIISRFLSINMPILKIGFDFIPIVICAKRYGAVSTGIVAALIDFVGANLFSFGAYFPGFTISAVISGLIMGYFFYNKVISIQRYFLVFSLEGVIVTILLNSFFISFLSDTPLYVLLPVRIFQCCLLVVIKTCVSYYVLQRIPFSKFV